MSDYHPLFLRQSLLSININLPIVKLLVSNYQVIYFVYNFFDIHYQQHFERHVTVEDFRTWIKIHACSFIKTLVNIMKRKSTEVP